MTRDSEYSWRGFVEPRGDVTRARFPLTDATLDLVCDCADGLYGWIAPELPEDLTLLRTDLIGHSGA